MALGIVIVAKDRHTVVALPDGRCYYNLNGNAGMATGGSGDVLCGIITGLLAQGYSPEDAALLGVYLHAAAGDAAVTFTGQEAMLAGDIASNIGSAYLSLS
jgi:NAD(P)H-hydrate epimerase